MNPSVMIKIEAHILVREMLRLGSGPGDTVAMHLIRGALFSTRYEGMPWGIA